MAGEKHNLTPMDTAVIRAAVIAFVAMIAGTDNHVDAVFEVDNAKYRLIFKREGDADVQTNV